MPPVKGQNPSRADRARQTRLRMLESARVLFINERYAATTMEQIAATAGVAVQTLYYTFGTKGRLLCEVVEFAGAVDDEPLPVGQRPWMRESLSTPSAQRALALVVEHATDIYVGAAPLWPAVHAAVAADPDVERYWRTLAATRRTGQRRLVDRLSESGALRDGLDLERATDLIVVLFGHDVFRELAEAGWTVLTYKAWLFRTLVQQLLAAERLEPTAFRDMTYAGLVLDL
jgi:TetR/AcrR family transcriptional regulator of autoinduction and epiphytic fitness